MASLSASGIPSTQSPTVKLRGSCHACALSKLKCSQDKPTCARCTKRGTTCQYLASKRAGRKQGSRTGSLKSPMRSDYQSMSVDEDDEHKEFLAASSQLMQYALQQDRNLEAYRGHHHQRTPSYPESVPSLLSSAGPTTSATTPLTFGHPDFDTFLASPVSLSLLDAPDVDYFSGTDVNFRDLNSFPDPSSFFPPVDPIPALEENILKAAFEPASTNTLSESASSPPTTEISSIGSIPQCFCFARSLSLLRELFPNPSQACPTATPDEQEHPTPPTIQQVITQNEQTIKEITQILQCSCSQDGYTLTILTLTVFKVLAWYNAIVQDSPLPEERHTQPEQVDKAPAIIRGYHLEGEEQGRMAAQLVLGELHRVQHLVNTLFQRLKDQGSREELLTGTLGTASRHGHAVAQDSILPMQLLDKLAGDLGARLRGLSSEIVDRLRRG
ncbi:aflatoxin regulatory protein-domain-containing protein [Aspergillus karnatakaensis]|uniref:Zn(II)2Cys6 domain-containing transcription factor tpcE n=1 Tax=Aspergillus karnatakaensis TaxID=1810916 RepID=UPI003CCD3356